MSNSELHRLYERSQQRRGLRPRTIIERDRFLRRVGALGPLLTLSTAELEDWLDAQQISLRSRKAYLSNLSAFYGWAVLAGYRDDDPTSRIVAPKVPRLLPRPMNDDDLDMALSLATPRMRAWLTLACYAGFRCMEIAGLRREDVLDRHDPPLVLVADGKGGKEGVLPMHPAILDALHEHGMPASGPVFVSSRGRPFHPATVSGYVAGYLHDLGVPATCHMARHWYGTRLYGSTHDLRLTQEMMRHSDPASTAGYVAFDNLDAVYAVTHLAPVFDRPTLFRPTATRQA